MFRLLCALRLGRELGLDRTLAQAKQQLLRCRLVDPLRLRTRVELREQRKRITRERSAIDEVSAQLAARIVVQVRCG